MENREFGVMDQDRPSQRTEKDSLGEVRVPTDALYGAQTQRAVDNFPISGLRPWRAFIWSMAVIKRAAAEVNRDLGLLDKGLAQAISSAAEEVTSGRWDDISWWILSRLVQGQATT